MKCPWCSKSGFVPNVVIYNCEAYGDHTYHFRCVHCDKMVKMSARRKIVFSEPTRSDREEGDWG
jgi:hypothetical protein